MINYVKYTLVDYKLLCGFFSQVVDLTIVNAVYSRRARPLAVIHDVNFRLKRSDSVDGVSLPSGDNVVVRICSHSAKTNYLLSAMNITLKPKTLHHRCYGVVLTLAFRQCE